MYGLESCKDVQKNQANLGSVKGGKKGMVRYAINYIWPVNVNGEPQSVS